MPIRLASDAPTLLIRRDAFERAQLTREGVDRWLNLTEDEFRVGEGLVVIGPIYNADGLEAFVSALEEMGLAHYEEFFDLSGNWPSWLALWASQDTGR